jgi:hypothetical protein
LAKYRDKACKASETEIAQALTGTYREEHLFALKLAYGLHRSQGALGAFLRRMKSRLGTAAALTATAHKLARIVYLALKHGLPYVRKSQEEYEAQMKEKQIQTLKRKARQLELELIEQPSAGSGTAETQVRG